jgi:O-succinylbenzoic acid--CoA ligase
VSFDPSRPWLLERAARTPKAPALSLAGGVAGDSAREARALDWSELASEARAMAAVLAQAGVEPGDRVATLLRSSEFAIVAHAVWLRGATLLPLNLRLAAPELVFQLRDAEARLLVHGDGELAARADEVAAAVPTLAKAAGGVGASLRAATDEAVASPAFARAPLAILYTSGTTGRPKGAVLSAASFLASAEASRRHLGSRPDDRCLACMPLFHVGGLSILVRSLLLGSCVEVQDGFDAEAVAAALHANRITDVSFVANMLARVLDVRGERRAPAALRTVLLGGGPVPEPLLREARGRGYPVAPTYGLTEACSQVATRAPGDDGAAGLRPLPGVDLRIAADGEILVRGPMLMDRYWKRPAETSRALRDGWLHTGDVGRLHADGTLTVLDRRRDLIVSGGENVYPAEIEEVLLAHPDVAEAGVGPRPDPRYGARPVAWIVARPGRTPVDAELAAFCRERLAAFKLPVGFHRVSELPRTAAGKLKRFELVEPPG